jgi:hypothetical protein
MCFYIRFLPEYLCRLRIYSVDKRSSAGVRTHLIIHRNCTVGQCILGVTCASRVHHVLLNFMIIYALTRIIDTMQCIKLLFGPRFPQSEKISSTENFPTSDPTRRFLLMSKWIHAAQKCPLSSLRETEKLSYQIVGLQHVRYNSTIADYLACVRCIAVVRSKNATRRMVIPKLIDQNMSTHPQNNA